jgi:hypothetical protein
MRTLVRTSALIVGSLFLIFQATAQIQPLRPDRVTPPDTAAFVSYCDNHFEACRIAIVDVNNYIMINILMGDHHGCGLPRFTSPTRDEHTAQRGAEAQKILVWLKANSGSRAGKTDDAITQAIKALWPKECT